MSDVTSSDIDELDLAILAHLQDDGRKSFTKIAQALDVAVGTVRNRLNKMMADNTAQVILRVNPNRVGLYAPATIEVSIEPAHLEEATVEIASFPEVSWLASITGAHDLVVDVMCRDAIHLKTFLTQHLAKVIGVKEMKSSFYLQIHKIALPDLRLLRDDSLTEKIEYRNTTR